MIKADKTVITVIEGLQKSLSARNFKTYLNDQISQYEMTVDFLSTFADSLDVATLMQQSLSADCIRYLCSKNLFDYNLWLNGIEHKNIDILLDDEFVKEYNVDIDSILEKTKKISPQIFTKFINTCGSVAKLNLLLNYSGDELTLQIIADNIDILGRHVFDIMKAREDLNKDDSIIEKVVLNSSKPIDILLYLEMIYYSYNPKLVEATIDELNFKQDEEYSSDDFSKARKLLYTILDRYPDVAVWKIVEAVYYTNKYILLDKQTLLYILTIKLRVPEDLLVEISDVFVISGLRDELFNYCRNHGYTNACTAIIVA